MKVRQCERPRAGRRPPVFSLPVFAAVKYTLRGSTGVVLPGQNCETVIGISHWYPSIKCIRPLFNHLKYILQN